MVVDDSASARHLIHRVLDEHPEVDVVGEAQNGTEAIDLALQLHPDLVFLDHEMPGLTGIETLRSLSAQLPKTTYLMLSSADARRDGLVGSAVAAGARAWLAKPSSRDGLRKLLHGEIDLLTARARRVVPRQKRVERPSTQLDLVAIGTSTGGPDALATLLPPLPAALPVPIVIVQHMPPRFTGLLAERLNAHCPWPVVEATDGCRLASGAVWIAPGGRHLEVQGLPGAYRAKLTDDALVHGCRPSVDVMYRSLARRDAGNVLAVVLTGMGRDGADGAKLLHDRGCTVIAQDQDSSVVWGMPGAVVEAKIADAVLPLRNIPRAISARFPPQRVRSQS